jgi:hypothetical protein
LIVERLLGEGAKEQRGTLRRPANCNDDFNDGVFEHALRILQDEIVFTRPTSYVALIKERRDLYSLTFDTTSGAVPRLDQRSFGLWAQRVSPANSTSTMASSNSMEALYRPEEFMALNNDNMFRMTGVQTSKAISASTSP